MSSSMNRNSAELSESNSFLSREAAPTSARSTALYYPWILIFLCSLFLIYKYILQVSPSVMTSDLMREFQMSGAGLGNLAATYFYAYLVMQLVAGLLLDRYSPRYLTTLAIGCCALGAFAFANTHSLFAAECARALMGAGTAFATVSYMKMSAMWFPQNKVAFVDGLLASAAMFGALCGQVPLTILVNHTSWRTSILYCGLFGLVFMILFFMIARDKKELSYAAQSYSAPKMTDLIALLKAKKNWMLTFYSGLVFTPIAVLGGLWGNPFFEVAHHLTATEAAFYTSLIFLGLALGSPLFGLFADRLGDRVKVMMVGTGIAFISLMLAIYVLALPNWLFGSMLFIFGLGTGVFMLSYPLGKELNHIGLAATVVALINTGDALFGSFTEPLVGKLLDLYWHGEMLNGVRHFSVADYHIALALCPLYLLAAFGCLCILKKMR